CILDRCTKRAGVALASVQVLLARFEQNFVQAPVGVHQRQLRRANRKLYFVNFAAKFDIVPEDTSELRNPFPADVHQGYAFGQELPTAEQPRYAYHRHDAKFDLLPISMARDARIVQAQCMGARPILKRDGFIGDPTVTGSTLQCFPKRVGRRHDVVEQSKVSTVKLFGEAKTKELVVERLGNDFKKGDLASGVDALLGIVDLINGQSSAQ